MNENGYLPMFNERKDADKRLLGLSLKEREWERKLKA
jgi:hypothetical protein